MRFYLSYKSWYWTAWLAGQWYRAPAAPCPKQPWEWVAFDYMFSKRAILFAVSQAGGLRVRSSKLKVEVPCWILAQSPPWQGNCHEFPFPVETIGTAGGERVKIICTFFLPLWVFGGLLLCIVCSFFNFRSCQGFLVAEILRTLATTKLNFTKKLTECSTA